MNYTYSCYTILEVTGFFKGLTLPGDMINIIE